MHSYYTRIARHFFSLKATRRKHLLHLAISSILGVVTFLLVPYMASRIIESLEKVDYGSAFTYIALFLASATIYLMCRHYNFWEY